MAQGVVGCDIGGHISRIYRTCAYGAALHPIGVCPYIEAPGTDRAARGHGAVDCGGSVGYVGAANGVDDVIGGWGCSFWKIDKTNKIISNATPCFYFSFFDSVYDTKSIVRLKPLPTSPVSINTWSAKLI